jgi:hypothetical protein
LVIDASPFDRPPNGHASPPTLAGDESDEIDESPGEAVREVECSGEIGDENSVRGMGAVAAAVMRRPVTVSVGDSFSG